MPARSDHPRDTDLIAYRAQRLSPHDAETVRRHLEDCASCQVFLNSLNLGATVATARPTPTLPPALPLAPPRVKPISQPARPTLPSHSALTGTSSSHEALSTELLNHPRYRLLQLLGEGSMGNVFLAEHLMMDRKVAIKIIHSKLLNNAEAIARFLGEVKTAAKLDHPNIVKAFDAEKLGSTYMFVMEYVDGHSLETLVQQYGKLSVTQACAYIRDAAFALQHAHKNDTVHRDVKPANMMVTSGGELKLCDFGLAKIAREHGDHQQSTAYSTLLGTPDFLAPEQAEQAKSADIRADIYSLGCTFFYLLTGRPPFQAKSMVTLLVMHRDEPPPRVSEFRNDVPQPIVELIERMMAKSKHLRPQTPQHVADALIPFAHDGRVLDAIPITVPPPTASPTLEPPKLVKFKPNTPTPTARPGPSIASSMASALGLSTPLSEKHLEQLRRKRPSKETPPDAPKSAATSTTPVDDAPSPDPVEVVDEKPKKPKKSKKKSAQKWTLTQWVTLAVGVGLVGVIGLVSLILLDGSGEPTKPIVVAPPLDETARPKPVIAPTPRFQPIWNGRNLSGWKTHEKQIGEWKVENGRLVGRAPEITHLYTTKDDYRQFHLKFKLRMLAGEFALIVGSGYGPTLPESTPTSPTGTVVAFELQSASAVNAIAAPNTSVLQPNQWATVEVIAEKNVIQVMVDGVPSARLDATLEPGHITLSLRKTNTHVEFESLELKPLDPMSAPTPPTDTIDDQSAVEYLPDEMPTTDSVLAKSKADEFQQLFNGRDLTGWTNLTGIRGNPGSWSVENGAIVSNGGYSNLLTDQDDFDDFHLRAEVKIDSGDSGLVFRAVRAPTARGELDLVSQHSQLTLETKRGLRVGSLYGGGGTEPVMYIPSRPTVEDIAGRWIVLEVLAQGERVQTYVDGKLAVNARGFQRRIRRGSIGLEQYGVNTRVHYRKVEIRRLPPPLGTRTEFISLFNGRDLEGWEPSPVSPGEWDVSNGILKSKLDGRIGALDSVRRDYFNFHLRCELLTNGTTTSFEIRTVPEISNDIGYILNLNLKGSFTDAHLKQSVPFNFANDTQPPANTWALWEIIAQDDQFWVRCNQHEVMYYRCKTLPSERHGLLILKSSRDQLRTKQPLEIRKLELRRLP